MTVDYYICDECHKPVKEEETSTILSDIRNSDNVRYKQYYCPQCFPAITFDKIQVNEKRIKSKPRK